jgi:hypothetical protein
MENATYMFNINYIPLNISILLTIKVHFKFNVKNNEHTP